MLTQWAKEVSPENALPEYPRPQMVRPLWQNLNGLWDYDIQARGAAEPSSYDGKILVPFAVESALSGVKKPVCSPACSSIPWSSVRPAKRSERARWLSSAWV